MATAKRPLPSDPDDVWRHHESKIRKLYTCGTNTVEDVKSIMEDTEGFPQLAISTWIEKLGQLGIRKNVLAEEWRKIYRHSLPRLEDPSRKKGDLKLKRTKKKTEIIVRGRIYNWDQAWKNMKSSNAIGQAMQPDEPLSPLPPEFVIRTPPLASRSIVPAYRRALRERALGTGDMTGHSTIIYDHARGYQQFHSGDGSMALAPHGHSRAEFIRSMVTNAEEVWKHCLAGLPIVAFVHHELNIVHLGTLPETFTKGFRQIPGLTNPSTSLPIEFNSNDPKTSSEPPASLRHEFLSAVLGLPSKDVTPFISDNGTYVALFTLIYIVSNNLVDYDIQGYGLKEYNRRRFWTPLGLAVWRFFKANQGPFSELFCKLDLIFAAVPGKHLENLLHSRLDSVRAAFETLIMLSGLYMQPRAFSLLVKVGAAYRWLDVSKKAQQLLILAVSMNQICALQTLLNSGCRPDSPASRLLSFSRTTAIVKAVELRNYDCAKLLLQYCDINRAIRPYMLYAQRNFDCSIWDYRDLWPGVSLRFFEYGLDLFFRAGANPDSQAPIFEHYSLRALKSIKLFHKQWSNQDCPEELKVSVLDYLFYFHRSIFHKAVSKSAQAQRGRLSRTGILLALERGNLSLEAYLHNLDGKVDRGLPEKVLRQVIAEQFLMCDCEAKKRSTNLETVQALASFVSIAEVLDDFPHILEDFIKLVPADCHRHEVEAAGYLLRNGATINSEALSWFAQLPSQRLFEIERIGIRCSKDLDTALINAAAQNNFEAVRKLLHIGAKLDEDVKQGAHGRISIIANIIASWDLKRPGAAGKLPNMVHFLAERGAPLRLSATRVHLYHLLHFTMGVFRDRAPQGDSLPVVHYIVKAGYEPRDRSFPSALLLESCDGLLDAHNVFEYLLRNGAQLRPGSPLATWIGMCGDIELVRDMLEKGVDINAYNHGSDVENGIPRRMTALQMAAMDWRVDVMELLLRAGADVNAPPKHAHGRTALQASCDDRARSSHEQQLKLRTVQLLLDHGADVNAAPARIAGITALQATAKWGDLAVAKLLLVHKPIADVNAPPCQRTLHPTVISTALDFAAHNGRIDMVKLLLNCNGVSHYRCETVFDGAANLAKSKGHFAVAELIRKHIEDIKASDATSPQVSQPARDWHEYNYELGSDDESELSEDDRLFRYYEDQEDDSNSISCSDIDQKDSSSSVCEVSRHGDSECSEGDTGSIMSLDLDSQDLSEDANDPDNHESPHSTARGELPVSTANTDNNIWPDQEDLTMAHEEDFTAARILPLSLQEVGFEDTMDLDDSMDIDTFIDYDTSFDSEMRQGAVVEDTAPWGLENHGQDDFMDFSQSTRLVEEVFGDCE